ncbi:Centromere protein C [Linum perenne]
MSNLEDPLHDYGGLSLFPRTFPSLPHHHLPNDLQSSHNFLKSLPVLNPAKLLEQAKSILTDDSKLLAAVDLPSKEKTEVLGDNPMENPRERRPGIGRKRARFSLLPTSSQSSSVSLERTLDIDKLKDPEEFFMAFERLENANKEIAKQTGNIQTDTNQPGAPVPSRLRRPGIPGRTRTAKYKHLYPTMQLQESSETELLNPSPGGPQPKVADKIDTSEEQYKPDDESSEEAELTGAAAEAEGRVNKILDDLGELLSQEGMDDDGAMSLLEDRLQIKPLDIGKLNLPELHQKIDLKPSTGRKFGKPRHALSDIHNILRETELKSPMILKKAEASGLSFGSPTPPKSPFASVSLLQKLTSQSDPLGDPFSAANIDLFSETNVCHKKDVNKVDASKEVNPLVIDEGDHADGGINSPVVADFTVLTNRSVEGDNATVSFGGEDIPSKFCAEVEGKKDSANEKEGDENLDQSCMAKELKETEPVHSAQPCLSVDGLVPTGCSNQNERDPNSSEILENCEMGGHSEFQSSAPEEDQDQVNSQDMHNENNTQEPSAVNVKEPSKRNTRKRKGCMSKLATKKQRFAATKASVVDECPDSKDTPQLIAPESQKEAIRESPVASANGQTKAKRRLVKGRESQAFSRRKSLAGAGSSYAVDGVRRSTRIRSRPLEYWKGERFLYGRIHESLATVIGIKYDSPGKDEGRPGLKVKSYVSDEYKHLVDLAALD